MLEWAGRNWSIKKKKEITNSGIIAILDLPRGGGIELNRRQPFVIRGSHLIVINSFPRQLIDLTSLRRDYVALHGRRDIHGSER